ncbi:MAG: hypothetical protein IIA33_09590 [Planctomycetes bacterium]|nr:hypothetical protein [Planctomycetota bacterium]
MFQLAELAGHVVELPFDGGDVAEQVFQRGRIARRRRISQCAFAVGRSDSAWVVL